MKKYLVLALLFCASLVVGFVNFNTTPSIDSNQISNTADMSEKSGKIIISGTMPLFELQDLVCDSDLIIKGRVAKKLKSKWSNEGFKKGNGVRNILQTDILIDIEKVYIGEPYDKKQIAVRIDKGETADLTVVSDGYPDFAPGEEVILFLSKDDSDVANTAENYYVLTGLRQGKFVQTENNNVYSNNKDEIELGKMNDMISEYIEKEKNNPYKKMTKEEIRNVNEKVFGK